MATSVLLRSLRRRCLETSYRSLGGGGGGKTTTSSLTTHKWPSLHRPFSSKPSGSDVIGIDLGTTNSRVTAMEGKIGFITQFCNYYSTKTIFSYARSENATSQSRASEGQYSMEMKRDTAHNYIGKHVSKKDKIKFLVNTLLSLKDSKEAVYGALDAWVAWEQRFPLASLRIALGTLEKEQEWHRVIQVIKWILSKGQGNTMGTYRQLISALDKDDRAEEAHNFWMKKIGTDLHSVPWPLCTLMISIYYRNKMLERLVKLFKGIESFDRTPPDKLVVQKVADAYEILGLVEQKDRVLKKYDGLFTETWKGHLKKSKKSSWKERKKSDERNKAVTSSSQQSNNDDEQITTSGSQNAMDEARVTLYSQQSNTSGPLDEAQPRNDTRLTT